MTGLALVASLLLAQPMPPAAVNSRGILGAGLCLTLQTSAGAVAQKWCATSANVSEIRNAAGTAKIKFGSAGEFETMADGPLVLYSNRGASTAGAAFVFDSRVAPLVYSDAFFSFRAGGVETFKVATDGGMVTAGNIITNQLAVTGGAIFGPRGHINTVPTGGAADCLGTATLVGGTVTVSTTCVTASSKVFTSMNTPGGTAGIISTPAASVTASTSFVVNSSSGADTSTVNWWVVN